MNNERIGISMSVNSGKDNLERLNDIVATNLKNIELYNKIVRVRYADIPLVNKLAKEKGIKFSFHSMVQDLFCDDEDIAKQEYYTLRGEIKLAALCGCARVIFHINKKIKLVWKDINDLRDIVGYANSMGVALALENMQSNIMAGEYLLELAKEIPDLKFCLDIGHLKVAINNSSILNKDHFVKNLASKIVELHISNNDGKKDEHKEIDSSSIDYLKEIGVLLGDNAADFIIETRTLEQAKKTLEVLTSLKW